MTGPLTPALAVLLPLVDDVPDPEDVTPGWVYAVVIIGLFAVTVLLWMSMRKQLGKIRFDDTDRDETPPRDGQAGSDDA